MVLILLIHRWTYNNQSKRLAIYILLFCTNIVCNHVNRRGLVGTCLTVAREEGPGALWKGLGPGLQRQVIYGGLRIGLYDPVKKFCTEVAGGDSLGVKIAAGLLSGAIGITIASPTDLVKVRMQSQKEVAGVPKKYPSALSAYRIIVK